MTLAYGPQNGAVPTMKIYNIWVSEGGSEPQPNALPGRRGRRKARALAGQPRQHVRK
jgi:hypothetical protein